MLTFTSIGLLSLLYNWIKITQCFKFLKRTFIEWHKAGQFVSVSGVCWNMRVPRVHICVHICVHMHAMYLTVRSDKTALMRSIFSLECGLQSYNWCPTLKSRDLTPPLWECPVVVEFCKLLTESGENVESIVTRCIVLFWELRVPLWSTY